MGSARLLVSRRGRRVFPAAKSEDRSVDAAAATQHFDAACRCRDTIDPPKPPAADESISPADGSPAQLMLRQDSAADRHGSGFGGDIIGGRGNTSSSASAAHPAAASSSGPCTSERDLRQGLTVRVSPLSRHDSANGDSAEPSNDCYSPCHERHDSACSLCVRTPLTQGADCPVRLLWDPHPTRLARMSRHIRIQAYRYHCTCGFPAAEPWEAAVGHLFLAALWLLLGWKVVAAGRCLAAAVASCVLPG